MHNTSEFVIQALIEDGKLSHDAADEIRRYTDEHEVGLEEAVIRLRLVSTRELAVAKASICEYPFLDLATINPDIRNSRALPKSLAEQTLVFPLFILGDIVTVAMEDPLDLQVMDRLQQVLRKQVDPVVCDAEQLRSLINNAYTLDTGEAFDQAEADHADESGTDEEPVVAAVNQILYASAEVGASDVHINPDEKALHLRYRVDGVLQPQQGPSLGMHEGIVQRLKVMAQLDVTQTRRPQDGKFRFRFRGTPIDVRLSVIPTIHGENAVLRLLAPASTIGSIKDLGMPNDVADGFGAMITKPHGVILVTGPTGSGKTTTLYTALKHINAPERNIMTIEDPVEIRLPLIRQVQANHAIGLTFASALRSMLRQDPDVILVGEIRDEDTAKIATQAALTGHLVFSTLHTNDAVGSIARLRDFGVPPFAVNNALLGVIAQRLVRKVCDNCAAPDNPSDHLLRSFGITPGEGSYVAGGGCPACLSTGYKGRVGVYECFRATDPVRRLIELSAPIAEIGDQARLDGMRTMLQDGIDKAKLGLTTVEELRKLHATIDAVSESTSDPEQNLKIPA